MWRERLMAQLERYLNEQCSLEEVDTWVMAHLQAILDSGDPKAIDITNEVDADIIEVGEGLIDDATLRERFQHYLASNRGNSSYLTYAHSESNVMFSPVGVPGAEVTIHFRHVVVA